MRDTCMRMHAHAHAHAHAHGVGLGWGGLGWGRVGWGGWGGAAAAAARLEVVEAPPLRRVILRDVRPHPAQAIVNDGPSRGHRQLELVGPDPLPIGRQRGPVVVVLVELAEEDQVDFVLVERREVPRHLRRQC